MPLENFWMIKEEKEANDNEEETKETKERKETKGENGEQTNESATNPGKRKELPMHFAFRKFLHCDSSVVDIRLICSFEIPCIRCP